LDAIKGSVDEASRDITHLIENHPSQRQLLPIRSGKEALGMPTNQESSRKSEVQETFYQRLTAYRGKNENLPAFTKRLSIPYSTLRRYEVGGNPTAHTVWKLSQRLGVDPG
jgi:hypothetical protein